MSNPLHLWSGLVMGAATAPDLVAENVSIRRSVHGKVIAVRRQIFSCPVRGDRHIDSDDSKLACTPADRDMLHMVLFGVAVEDPALVP